MLGVARRLLTISEDSSFGVCTNVMAVVRNILSKETHFIEKLKNTKNTYSGCVTGWLWYIGQAYD